MKNNKRGLRIGLILAVCLLVAIAGVVILLTGGSDAPLTDFTRDNITVEQTTEHAWRLTNNFTGGRHTRLTWSVYNLADLNEPIGGTDDSNTTTFEYTLPEDGGRYAVKATASNTRTQEEKSLWTAYFPDHPCTGFSGMDLAGNIRETPDGVTVSAASLFEVEVPVQYAWYVYSADDLNTPVYKTGYLDDTVFSVELPASDAGYRVFAYARDTLLQEHVKAEVVYWQDTDAFDSYPAVSDFSRAYISVEQTAEGTYRVTNRFEAGPRVQFAWYVYDVRDLKEKIGWKDYSYDRVFEYTLPEGDGTYAVKVFALDTVTGEKKSVWAAYLPDHPCVGFSSAYLAGNTQETQDGITVHAVSLYKTEVSVQYAWYVYSSDDLNTPVYKTGYQDETEFTVELPASDAGYQVYAYARDSLLQRSNKAKVGYWQTKELTEIDPDVDHFTRLNVSVEQTGDRTYRLTSDFNGGPEVQIAWGAYRKEDKNTKIEGKSYSYDPVYEYTLPEDGERYCIKAFVRNLVTGEQKSAWVAYLPFEQMPEAPEDPIPAFTRENIERTVLEEGYSFTNTFGEAGVAELGFEVYARNGAELTLLETVPGDTLRFQRDDSDQDYVLKAYARMENGAEKTVEFYRLYGETSCGILDEGALNANVTVEDLMAGIYMGQNVSPPVDWLLPNIRNRGSRNIWNNFRAQYLLIREYISTKDEDYALKFIEYMRDWLDQYPEVPPEEDDELWTDFSVSFRTRYFSIARVLFDHLIDNELLRQMESHLAQCADLLASEFNYKDKHNHGMYQDLSLLMYLDAFGYMDPAEEYRRELVQKRLEEYFSYSVSESGVHKEHSPSYHSDILETVSWLNVYLDRFADPAENHYQEISERMKNFYFDLMMPDFTWPILGDSFEVVLKPKGMTDDPRYQWLISQGTEGTPPEDRFSVYEDGGYAIMRSSWEDKPEEATYAILAAATHSSAHKHQDDLSFMLYHKGQLFTEAGKRDYNYAEPLTRYAYSSFAHNVLLVNNQGWPINELNHPVLDEAAYETRITGYGEEGDAMWASARSVRWPQVTQDRTLRYDRGLSQAEVTDVLTASEETDIRLIYHIAEGVDIEHTENGWLLSRDGEPVADVRVEATEPVTLSVLRGQEEDGDCKTWLFDSKHIDEPMYGGLLIVDMKCKPGENSVSLKLDLK